MYRNNVRITTSDRDMLIELMGLGLIVTIAKRTKKLEHATINLMIWADQDEIKINENTTEQEILEFIGRMGLADYYEQWILEIKDKYYTKQMPDRSKIHKHQYDYLFGFEGAFDEGVK